MDAYLCKVYTVVVLGTVYEIWLSLQPSVRTLQTMVCTIRCGDSMVLVFYGVRQYGAIVRRIFLLLEFLVALIRAVFFKLSVSNATN